MLTIIPGAFHTLMGLLMFKYKISDRVYEDIKLSLPDMEVIDGKSTPVTQPNVHKDSTQTQVSI
ncbi:sodium:galactoside symporter [Shewanella putrefaciens]|nr:sodium:galactoside symporter [Shewanella putrefaciens]